MDNQQTTSSSGVNQLFVNNDVSKIFLGNQQTEVDNYVNNSTYNPIVLFAGTVMGRVAGSDIICPWFSTAVDGSQVVQGILMMDITLAAGALVKVPLCVAGRVAAEKIIAAELSTQSVATTLQIIQNGRRLKDKIQGETVGVKLIYSAELTQFDNQ